MKASNFRYFRPKSLEEALAFLATKDEPRIIAGGQSLVAAMNMKLAQPETIIDIGELDELRIFEATSDEVHIGALVTHGEIEFSKNTSKLISFLSNVAKNIAHTPIRFKGTFCGAIANSDPASEWCACLLALDGSVEVIGQDKQRRNVNAKEFFIAPYLTNIGFDEILVTVNFPEVNDHTKLGFNEYARRAGDYAIAMCVSKLNMEDNKVIDGNIVIGAASETPIIIGEALNVLRGKSINKENCWEAANIASENVKILPDIDTSEDYKRDVIKAVTYRSLLACS